LERHPNDTYLLHLRGNALKLTGVTVEAHRVLNRCLAVDPDNTDVLMSLGAVCLDLGLPTEARTRLSRAIERGAASAEVWDNLGMAHEGLGDLAPALQAFETALTINPRLTPALANMVRALGDACDWERRARYESMLEATLGDPNGDARFPPHVALAMTLTPERHLRIARRWSTRILPPVTRVRPPMRSRRRVRVGYLSADFHSHPTSDLMVGLFERHDRNRFEVFAYSYGPDDASSMRRRLLGAFEHWTGVRSMSDPDAATRIRGDEIDILVDLKGHTWGSRLGILARRPAPLQLHYIGYPGTLGFDGIDALVADNVVAPPDEDEFFHEAVLRLPRCYQVNDDRRALPDATPRNALGLPDEALVIACFNKAYKLSRRVFGVWMEALLHSPTAVLWLLAPDPQTQTNLRAEAARGGVDPDRIVFAGVVPKEAHIARLRSADLALDVLPCGSHTTGSDALWAGVPLLSCRGETFAGRVGASLLTSVALSELIAESTEEYAAMLIALLADRKRLAAYRHYLDGERARLQLFDTAGFTRDWEALLASAWEDARAGPLRGAKIPRAKG
jgi:predicted O-linked N-acetylglucosamine transferase (SPINDLY family)